ncbi:pyrophosphohydrolase [Microlunatus elymi]|uniref:Pyrophosphohydrolase n=2 Tax=Microlunatus elymi TaxID=2596828 RepID=A0A516Q684_9ACTN|nr:pyrophosphohydrolase [Microlunatus elymi]
MTFAQFQDYVKKLEQDRGFTGDSVLQKCLLLGEEVGELFRSVRKTTGVSMDVVAAHQENPAHEMADILIVLATIANRLDIDLAEAIRAKEQINARRQWA